MSQCLLQQNKDFNPISPTRPNHRDVAMPPPTEQGFQRENMGGFERIREVAMPPPTEQGFQRDIGPAPHTPNIVAMPPPTEQGFQPHYQGRLYREVPRRNAPPTEQGFQRSTRCPGPRLPVVAMPPPTEQGFQHPVLEGRPGVSRSQCPLQQNKDFNSVSQSFGSS